MNKQLADALSLQVDVLQSKLISQWQRNSNITKYITIFKFFFKIY